MYTLKGEKFGSCGDQAKRRDGFAFRRQVTTTIIAIMATICQYCMQKRKCFYILFDYCG
jgi:hypothetical protein